MSINNLTVSGYLGSDLEVRYFKSGKAIGETSLPCVSGHGDHERTTWLRCKILGERAKKLEGALTKGALVTFSGEFYMDGWKDKQGKENTVPVLVVDGIQLPPKPRPTS